jgi:hypothetical protein
MPGSPQRTQSSSIKGSPRRHRVGHFIYVHNGLGPLESSSEAPGNGDGLKLISFCFPSVFPVSSVVKIPGTLFYDSRAF